MTENRRLQNRKTDHGLEVADSARSKTVVPKYSRRDALRALRKYSAFIGTAGIIVLSAEDAVAHHPCSSYPDSDECAH